LNSSASERDEESRNQSLLTLASEVHLPVIATNGMRYSTAQDREILDVLNSAAQG
jgi:error-prone DNA polymerase